MYDLRASDTKTKLGHLHRKIQEYKMRIVYCTKYNTGYWCVCVMRVLPIHPIFKFVVKFLLNSNGFEIVLIIPANDNLEEVPTGWYTEEDFQRTGVRIFYELRIPRVSADKSDWRSSQLGGGAHPISQES